jgi:WD40 repeat protein
MTSLTLYVCVLPRALTSTSVPFLPLFLRLRLMTWDVASGDLLSIIPSAHYRSVTTVRFTDDGGHLVSASDDGTVKVWKTRALVDLAHVRAGGGGGAGSIVPCYTWAEHTLPVTDVHCGFGGFGARIVTTSKDCSCKLWDLASGELVGSLSFPSDLHSVTTDPADQYLYAGGGNGTVYAVALFKLPELSPAVPTLLRQKDLLCFVGHTQVSRPAAHLSTIHFCRALPQARAHHSESP